MRFFDFSPADLYDRNIPLSLLNKNEFSEIEEKLNEAVSFTDKVTVAEKFLNNRFQINKERYAFKRIKYCTERIENSKAIISVDLLASETFLSRRQFERIFSEYVGTSPKQFLQTIRFQHVLFRKSKYPDDTLTALAYDCGYYDQAHMCREFRGLTGMSPKTFFSISGPASDYFG